MLATDRGVFDQSESRVPHLFLSILFRSYCWNGRRTNRSADLTECDTSRQASASMPTTLRPLQTLYFRSGRKRLVVFAHASERSSTSAPRSLGRFLNT